MSADHDDYQTEPVLGLPEMLPPGEHILWQGAPQWWELAKEVFHIRVVALYFVGLMAWRASARMADFGDERAGIAAVLSLTPIALIGLGLLVLLAVLNSRTTVYTITNRRVVLRIGIAITLAINIPFKAVTSAGVRLGARRSGDIALTLTDEARLAYGTLWPHARAWRFNHPEPMLRGVANVTEVGAILMSAVRDAVPSVKSGVGLPTIESAGGKPQNISVPHPA